jgi:hypothetical protein
VIGVLPLGERGDVRFDVRIGFRVEQRFDNVCVALGGGPHERRLLLIGVGRVDVRACFEQQPDGFGVTRVRCRHQRGLALAVGNLEVASGPEQRLDDRRSAGAAGLKQRCDAVLIRCVRLGAGRDQGLRHREIGLIGGPEKRRRSITSGFVDVNALGNQCADGGNVTFLGSFNESAVSCRLPRSPWEGKDNRQERNQ